MIILYKICLLSLNVSASSILVAINDFRGRGLGPLNLFFHFFGKNGVLLLYDIHRIVWVLHEVEVDMSLDWQGHHFLVGQGESGHKRQDALSADEGGVGSVVAEVGEGNVRDAALVS